MPDENAVYKAAQKVTTWNVTNADISYTMDSKYTIMDMDKPTKRNPHMKCKSCGNIFEINDDLFDEDHCTFECKYNKSKSNANSK